MSQNGSKRRIIPCGSSGCSSPSSSEGKGALIEDDDNETEAQLYSPSTSDNKSFNMPSGRPMTAQERRNGTATQLSQKSFPSTSSSSGISSISSQQALSKRRAAPDPPPIGRPATGINQRRLFGDQPLALRSISPSRSTASVSFQSSTSSDDYSIALPPRDFNTHNRSVTAKGRHMSMSDESRTASRQSIMTNSSTYSILDARQIHVYLKKNDSQLSLTSIQTMSQLALDGNEDSEQPENANGSSPTNESQNDRDSVGSQKVERVTSTFHTSPPHLRAAEDAQWRSATHSPDDDQYIRPRSQYVGELVWQVDQIVYCGGIQAAQNLNLLCRLNIEYIVDLCGEESETIARYYRPRPECPCLCTRKTAHSRMTMTINIKDDSDSNVRVELTESANLIITYFGDLINIIHKARIAGKSVLIHSMKGRNRAPAFVCAYLMQSQRCTRVQALSQISNLMSKTRPSIGLAVSDNFLRALNHWQNLLGIKSNESFLNQTSATVFQIKKTAWNG